MLNEEKVLKMHATSLIRIPIHFQKLGQKLLLIAKKYSIED
jgi:hypothetical protein